MRRVEVDTQPPLERTAGTSGNPKFQGLQNKQQTVGKPEDVTASRAGDTCPGRLSPDGNLPDTPLSQWGTEAANLMKCIVKWEIIELGLQRAHRATDEETEAKRGVALA